MSVTRNANRTDTYDLFETPKHAVDSLLRWPRFAALVRDRDATILEPAAGRGAILRALLAGGVAAPRLCAAELDGRNREPLARLGPAAVWCPADAVAVSGRILAPGYDVPTRGFDAVVTNPPFVLFDGSEGIAAFARASLAFARPGGLAILLARHDYPLPLDRRALFDDIGYPAHILGLERRCSFTRVAACKDCGGRWTTGSYDLNKTAHGETMPMERIPKAVLDKAKKAGSDEPVTRFLAGIAACPRVGSMLPAREQSDTNGYAWLVWIGGERHEVAQHEVLRDAARKPRAKRARRKAQTGLFDGAERAAATPAQGGAT